MHELGMEYYQVKKGFPIGKPPPFRAAVILKVSRSGNLSSHFGGVYNLNLNSDKEGICGNLGFPIKILSKNIGFFML